ncbi:hypothetical protein [Streptomyces sp. NPDC056975]|uniref:hypothetical protein n=1 Tax=unclassified Streptomyces TaxID=2593676 RepID=UPI0036417D36
MRHHPGSLLRRTAVGAISLAAHSATCGAAARPGGANGRVGLVAYRGDRGVKGDAPSVAPGCRARPVALGNSATPADDVLNSSISEPGRAQPRRVPAYATTLGYDPDVFALGRSVRQRGPGPGLRTTSRRDTAWIGVLFAAVDARP